MRDPTQRRVVPLRTGMRRNILSVKRRRIQSIHIQNVTVSGIQARTEINTRADNSCSGINFWLNELTGQKCSVAPFSASYEPMSDIQIKTCLTSFTDEDGSTWILVFNEVLWFGSNMDNSLVNPNQIRMTGTLVSDDPFDTTRRLGIHHKYAFIPFMIDGTTVYFDTHVPTDSERAQCTWITMTGDTEWYRHW